MSALAAHLWQSTWFAAIVGLLAWSMRNEPARVRYWIWFAGSLKFVVPFAFLAAIGRLFVVQVEDEAAFLPLVKQATAPFIVAELDSFAISDSALLIAAIVWAAGAVFVLSRWIREWWHVRGVAHRGRYVTSRARIPVIASDEMTEPGVFGLRHPVLLLPGELFEQLPREEFEAVIAHELQHVRRRDNPFAAVQALIQALVWFHPMIWWIGKHLMETREQACDEAVVEAGHERTTYAHAIVRVCKHALESRAACVAHAAGGDLASRIRALLSRDGLPRVSIYRIGVLVIAAFATIALPIASGATVIAISQFSPAAGSHSIRISADDGPAFVAATNDFVYARNVSLRELIGHVYSISPSRVQGQLAGLDQPRYDIELSAPSGVHIDHRQLVAAALNHQFNLQLVSFPALPSNQ